MNLDVVKGDITMQRVDAVVNAADRAMRGGGGVDGAIHGAGGPDILRDCIERFPNGLETGQAGWTTAGRLPARYVIHVVGPNYRIGERDRALLVSCYANALRVADELQIRSIAFPLVSAGIFGWPKHDAVRAAVDSIRATETSLHAAYIIAFDDATHQLVSAAL